MTDYTLTPHPDDPPWATSREPAPALWSCWCNECEVRDARWPRERGYGFMHQMLTTLTSPVLSAPLNMDGYSPWQRVEGTGVESASEQRRAMFPAALTVEAAHNAAINCGRPDCSWCYPRGTGVESPREVTT